MAGFDAINAANTAANAGNSDAAASRTRLSDNYDTFLVLLTAQLQNQDPLAPMDSTQFTQQLVQFSQVEQQIRTNEQLEGLVGQYKASTAGAALSYLGRDAIIETDSTASAGTGANWAYKLAGSAQELTLTVRDANNRDVFSTTTGDKTQGEHLFAWNGKDADGNVLPNGVYHLVVTAKNADGSAVGSTTTVRETIRGVDFTGASPTVITNSGSRDLSLVRAVLDVN